MKNLGILGMFDKLDDIIYKPVEAISEWVKEPLKSYEHKRNLSKLEKESDLSLKQENELNKINSQNKEQETNLKIKEETEINRINSEIEEWKKDKHLERLVKVAEATTKYQTELSRINTDAIKVIGNMQLELRGKAQDMILEKTIKYKEIQKEATDEAMNDFIKIEENFSGNEVVKNILYKQIDNRMSNIIDSARNFITELHNDLANLNQDISKLTEFGQKSVEKLMDKFRDVGNPNETTINNQIPPNNIIE